MTAPTTDSFMYQTMIRQPDEIARLVDSGWEQARAAADLLGPSRRITITGIGTSYHAALVGSWLLRAAGRDDTEVPALLATEAGRIGFDARFIDRPLNVDLSGGERKRNETMQLGVLRPKFAVLDELDSGLDVDALRDVARRIEAATSEDNLGVLAITHYSRLLTELRPDVVHVLARGRIVKTGGPELAQELEETGYAEFVEAEAPAPSAKDDPFADPFADPLA